MTGYQLKLFARQGAIGRKRNCRFQMISTPPVRYSLTIPDYRHGTRLERGFTLIELLVVIVIIVAATAVVAPNLGSRVRQAQLDSGAARLDALARHARTRAVLDRRPIVLTASPDGRYIYLNYTDDQAPSLNTLPLDMGASIRIQISRTGSEEEGVTFSPDGTVTETWFELSSSSGNRQLRLDPVRAKVTSGNS